MTHFRWFDRFIPGACCLCGVATLRARDLCAACEVELPALPPGCARCALPLASGPTPRCGACLVRPPRFSACTAALVYAYPVREMILRFKQQGDLAMGRVLSGVLAARIARLPAEERQGRVLVPMPMRDSRLGERGFNQAERIARALSRALGLPLDQSLARRVRDAHDQKRLSASARRANLRGAFAAGQCEGRRLAIVDDVVTTGASANALAGSLLATGAADVVVWSVARVL